MYIMLIAQTINFLCHSAQPYKGILLTHILIFSPTAADTAVVVVEATVVVEEVATVVVEEDTEEEEVVDMAAVVVDLVVRTLYQQSYIARANAPGSGGYGGGGFGGTF